MTILQVQGLTKSFGRGKSKKLVLDDVTFDLEEGEILAIVGESGSGKSTILNLVSKRLRPDSGTINFQGRPLEDYGKDLYKSMQMVFQNARASFDPKYTIGASIQEVLDQLRSDADISIGDLLKMTGLKPSYKDRLPSELSGGENQRAAISRSFSVLPRLLLCDEITSALDVCAQAKVIEYLYSLVKDQGISVLFVSHDMSLVSTFCDRVLVLNKGRIVEEGPTKEVLANPQDPYTQALCQAHRFLEDK